MPSCSLTLSNNSLVVKTPYDAGFVTALKATIPATQRRFDYDTKAWLVEPGQGRAVADLIAQYFGEMAMVPAMTAQPRLETRVLEIHYLGQCKDRGSEYSAFGLDAAGQWLTVFPESVLRSWFMDNGQTTPTGKQTLYQTLNISREAEAGEIKSAFRRLARQWHPDVCKEPDAAQVFMKIKDAYELLSDPERRARYNAGLMLEASLDNVRQDYVSSAPGFRAPLRCGYIMAEGHESLGRFVVGKILAWEDITNGRGQTLVSSWPAGSDHCVEVWA